MWSCMEELSFHKDRLAMNLGDYESSLGIMSACKLLLV